MVLGRERGSWETPASTLFQEWYELLLPSENREPPRVALLAQSWASRGQKLMNLLKRIYHLQLGFFLITALASG